MKKIIILSGILFIAVMAIGLNYSNSFRPNKDYNLKTFVIDNGWGYTIQKKEKIIIKQSNIPSIQVSKPFKTRDDAVKVGTLVINKLRNKKSPTISYQELLINKVNL